MDIIGNGHIPDWMASLVMQEKVFSVAKRFAIGASDVVDIVIDPTLINDDEQAIFTPLHFKAFGAGPINIDIYFGATYTGATGTEWSAFNRNTRSTKTAQIKTILGPTITDPGVLLPINFVIFSDGVPATASIGGEQEDDLPFVSRVDGVYLIRMTNTEANPAVGWFGSNFAELLKV